MAGRSIHAIQQQSCHVANSRARAGAKALSNSKWLIRLNTLKSNIGRNLFPPANNICAKALL